MRRVVMLLPLLFGGCSCQPDPVAGSAPTGTAADTAVLPDADAPAASEPETATPVAATLSAVAPGAPDEVATVHEYIYSLLATDRGASDGYWTGGSAGPRPDDQLLRVIPDLRNLRVKTSLPVARDDRQPSHLIEVPVHIRATAGHSTLIFTGWYRLQPRPDASAWEIHSASLQPVVR